MSAARPVRLVAIGGSAGGIEALGALLPALPATFRPSVVVVLHLLASKPSLLSDIFAPRCALPVREPLDKDAVEPGTIYFAPPGYHLMIERDEPRSEACHFALSTDAPVHNSRPAIDVLFESVAEVYGARAAGVVLSGANTDGALGLAAIQRAGGVALVQAPHTAQIETMPRAAIGAGPVDAVEELERLAARLQSMDG
ncbi:MAG: chemotaxis protein CheB [Archangium sp.]|nr:chemotaxis protein CheB [Archangium sp.]